MKKKYIAIILLAAVALVLFFPIPRGTYDDGGTREYTALTYKIVSWHKLVSIYDENGQLSPSVYENTSVYWFPDNLKKIDELWKMENSVQSVRVTSLPKGYEYSFEKEDAQAVIDYFSDLDLIADFEENPDEYKGLTWVITFEYSTGGSVTVYHFGNAFVKQAGGPWYKMTYEQASRFESLLNELNN